MNNFDLPFKSFIGGWFIPDKVCDKVIDYFESKSDNHVKGTIGDNAWHFEENGDDKKRHLVFMTFLNDVENGGTEFKYQNLTIPAKKGLTLIWPAPWTHTHKGQVSNTQTKYIITGWYNFNE